MKKNKKEAHGDKDAQISGLQEEIGELTQSAFKEPVSRQGFATLKSVTELSMIRRMLDRLGALTGGKFHDEVKQGRGRNCDD